VTPGAVTDQGSPCAIIFKSKFESHGTSLDAHLYRDSIGESVIVGQTAGAFKASAAMANPAAGAEVIFPMHPLFGSYKESRRKCTGAHENDFIARG
jgi:hypothetical protein